MKISKEAKNAIYLGILCSVSYFAVYIARNMLGAVTPKMTEDGFSLDYIGSISAAYLLCYAVGQLINGVLGDWIKAKYMICLGLGLAGLSSCAFVLFSDLPNVAMVAYGCAGFALSMIYGPMTKVVAENTSLVYATRCSLGYTFSSFFASPMAGILATFLTWQVSFHISSAALLGMAILCFVFFGIFEKKGIVQYAAREKRNQEKKDYKILFKRRIVTFSFVSMFTGIIRTSWVAFLTMYFVERLHFSSVQSTSIFSTTTFVIAFTTFIAIFIYERLKKNMDLSQFIFFSTAAVSFALTYFVNAPVWNIVFMVLAIMASNAAATMLWSVYCNSMADTGFVSGVTGFLDCLSYIAAASASLLIPKMVAVIGWKNMSLVLTAIMLGGVTLCLPYFIRRKKKAAG